MATKIGEAFIEIRSRGDAAVQDARKIADQIGDQKVVMNLDASAIRSQIGDLKSDIASLSKGAELTIKTRQLKEAQADLGRLNDAVRQLQSAGGKLSIDTSGIAKVSTDLKTVRTALTDLTSTRAKITIDADTVSVDRIRTQLSDVGDIMREVDGQTVKIDVEADAAKATDEFQSVDDLVRNLDGASAVVTLTARAERLKADLKEVDRGIDSLDNETIAVRMELRSDIVGDLDKIDNRLKQLGSQANVTGRSLGGLRGSASQTRNVMSNMVGNSVQDLGALTGVAGSAGVAIGQLAEYAADGDIKLQGLGKAVGIMAGIAAATALVSVGLEQNARRAKNHTDQIMRMGEALREGTGFARSFVEQIETTGKLDMRGFLGELEDVVPLLGKAGVSVQQFSAAISGGQPALDALRSAMSAAGVDTETSARVMLAATQANADYAVETQRSADATRILMTTLDEGQAAANGFEQRVAGIGGALRDNAYDAENAAVMLARTHPRELTSAFLAFGPALQGTAVGMDSVADRAAKVGEAFDAIAATSVRTSAVIGGQTQANIAGAKSYVDAMTQVRLIMAQGPSVEGGVAGMTAYNDQLFSLSRIAGQADAAVEGMSAALDANGGSFEVSTEAGRANQAALEGLAGSLIPQITSNYVAAGGSLEAFAASQQTANANLRASLETAGVAAGHAQEIADKLIPLDGLSIQTQFELLGTEDAATKLAAILPLLDSLNLPEPIIRQVGLQILAGADPATILGTINSGLAAGGPTYVPVGGKLDEASIGFVVSQAKSLAGGTSAEVLLTARLEAAAARNQLEIMKAPREAVISAVALTGQAEGQIQGVALRQYLATITTGETGSAAAGNVISSVALAGYPAVITTSESGSAVAGGQISGVASSSYPATITTGESGADAVGSKISGIANATYRAIVNVALGAVPSAGGILNAIGPVVVRARVSTAGLTNVGGYGLAEGGRVPGIGNRDTVPALLTPGEFVINKRSAQALGSDALHNLNEIQRFHAGGTVQPPTWSLQQDPHNWRGIDVLLRDMAPGTPRVAASTGGSYSGGSSSSGGSSGGGSSGRGLSHVHNFDVHIDIGGKPIQDVVRYEIREHGKVVAAGTRHAN